MTQRVPLPFGSLPGEGTGEPTRREVLVAGTLPMIAALTAAFWPASFPTDLRAIVWVSLILPPGLLSVYRGRRGAAVGLTVSLVLLLTGEFALRALLGRPIAWGLISGASIATAAVAWSLARVTDRLHELRREAVQQAFRDEETGLQQRDLLQLFLEQHVSAADRGGELTLVLFGVGGLRELRRDHGDDPALDLLARIGDAIELNSRGMDVAGRFDDEEILAILPGTGVEGARIFAVRVLEKLTGLSAQSADGTMMGAGVGVRAGIAGFDEETEGAGELVSRARRALESVMRPGANRIAVFSEPAGGETRTGAPG